MPEVSVIRENISVDYESLDVANLIDLRYQLEQQRKEVAATEREIKKQMEDIDNRLWAYHEANPEVAEAQGQVAKIKWSEEDNYSTEAGRKEEVRDWLFDNGLQHLMTWHLNRAATQECVAMRGELPGVSTYVKRKVSCRKL